MTLICDCGIGYTIKKEPDRKYIVPEQCTFCKVKFPIKDKSNEDVSEDYDKKSVTTQFTEKEVALILNNQWPNGDKETKLSQKIDRLRVKGFIKKSAIEEARELKGEVLENIPGIGRRLFPIQKVLRIIFELYEKAYNEK
jgi:hypothetical protein